VERSATQRVFDGPAHPYTHGLLRCQPSRAKSGETLYTLPGVPPGPGQSPPGCAFADRCPKVQTKCRQVDPEETEVKPGHYTRCFYPFVP
jgi:oligopeptide/dipeptide ABC transporter ATP-binding protein